jgi:hypothetical protein
MTADDAKKFGVDEEKRRSFIVVSDDKHNRAPSENGNWFELVSVELGNGSFEHRGDSVAALQPWSPPTVVEPRLTPFDIFEIQRLVDAKPCRENVQSADWVGHAIAQVLRLDLNSTTHKRRVKVVQKDLTVSKHLRTECRKDSASKSRSYVVTGTRITLDDLGLADLL